MQRGIKSISLLFLLIVISFSCDRNDQETPEPTDFGYLSLNVGISVSSQPASGRIEAVSTDDWSVTIFNASDDSEAINFTPFIDAPAEVQLPTGEYYVEAHSNNFAEAAFENPYYFGRSDNFTIDKEELKTIDVNAELANSIVKINYLPSVTNTFDRYSGTVTVVGSGESLFYNETETREGYFVSAPLAVEVNLSYDKLGGGTIDRTFATEIDAQPKTLYNINVDATLEDGKIMLNINVNEDFETEEIDLGKDTGSEISRIFPGSQTIRQEDEARLLGWIEEKYHFEATLQFTKLYGDGKGSTDFHQACDYIANTLTVIKTTTGYVFGGFNSGVWIDNAGWPGTQLVDNFLFTLNNNMKWVLRDDEPYVNYGIFNGYWGPTFGGGSAHDLYINPSLLSGYTWKSAYYPEGTDPQSIPEGYNPNFTGSDGSEWSWTIDVLEVWVLNTKLKSELDSDGDGIPDDAEISGCVFNAGC